jgi:hypothetical protein
LKQSKKLQKAAAKQQKLLKPLPAEVGSHSTEAASLSPGFYAATMR